MATPIMDNVLRKLRDVEKDLVGLKDQQLQVVKTNGQLQHGSNSAAHPTSAHAWLRSLKLQPEQWTAPPLVVLSLFDGIGGVWAALDLLGIPYRGYSAEIDKSALQLLRARYPSVQHIGDVLEVQKSHITEKVDLIVGGFPCQDLTALGKKTGRNMTEAIELAAYILQLRPTVLPLLVQRWVLQSSADLPLVFCRLHGTRSRLFFEMLRIIELFTPRWFLVENVASMFWVDRDEISRCLKCLPLEIDSQELTASKRRRLYWTNIKFPSRMPNLKHHYSTSLQSILENATALEVKAGCILASNFHPGNRGQLRAVMDNETKTLRCINTRELEKLMGYPVGYSNIKYRKGSAGCNGKKRGRTSWLNAESDKIRWSLLGNSFSVPVIAYLLHSLIDESACPQSQSSVPVEAVREEDSTAMKEGELWALYNSRKMPNWYAEIVSRTGGRFSPGEDKKLEFSVRFLELGPLYMRRESDQWSPNRGTGLYDIHDEVETQDCWVAFSHRVTSCIKTETGYFIYPDKDDIWAVYCPAAKNHYFVYIVESNFTKGIPDSSVKPDKESFHCYCRVLQETEILNTYRSTDMAFDCTNLSMFAFQTPYLYKNGLGLFKLETNGIRGAAQSWEERGSRKRRRKNGDDTSEDEDEVDDDDDEEPLADILEPPPDAEETQLGEETNDVTQQSPNEP